MVPEYLKGSTLFLLYNGFGMPGPNEALSSAVGEYQPVAIIPA